jgi:hypothetical protein
MVAAVAAVVSCVTLLVSAGRPHGNITCKTQVNGQPALCVQGQAHPVIVPYSAWRAARAGGYYDARSRSVFRSAGDDPHVSVPVEDHPVIVDGGR